MLEKGARSSKSQTKPILVPDDDHLAAGSQALPENSNQHGDDKMASKRSKLTAKDEPFAGPRSSSLSKVFKSYHGLDDVHIPIFQAVQRVVESGKVLYPGSFCHVQASLVFPDVTYVDCDPKLELCFNDEVVREWIHRNRGYRGPARVEFLCKNFDHELGLPEQAFDLLISASAGVVTRPCAKYIKVGGYIVVSDSHFDARTAYLDSRLTLRMVYDKETKSFSSNIDGCFETVESGPMTQAQVDLSFTKPKSKHPFKLKRDDALFFLFERVM